MVLSQSFIPHFLCCWWFNFNFVSLFFCLFAPGCSRSLLLIFARGCCFSSNTSYFWSLTLGESQCPCHLAPRNLHLAVVAQFTVALQWMFFFWFASLFCHLASSNLFFGFPWTLVWIVHTFILLHLSFPCCKLSHFDWVQVTWVRWWVIWPWGSSGKCFFRQCSFFPCYYPLVFYPLQLCALFLASFFFANQSSLPFFLLLSCLATCAFSSLGPFICFPLLDWLPSEIHLNTGFSTWAAHNSCSSCVHNASGNSSCTWV